MAEVNLQNNLPITPEEAHQGLEKNNKGTTEDSYRIEDQATGYYYWIESLDRRVDKGLITKEQKNRVEIEV